MLIDPVPNSVFRPTPPPLWYVTNGETTVGPVITSLLTRGVESRRIPEECRVRPAGGLWRSLKGVREVSALYRPVKAPAADPEQLVEWGLSSERIRDEMELCHTATWLSIVVTAAESAMFHYQGRFDRTLVTRAVLGPMPKDRLGYPLPEDDLLLRAARRGRPVTGPPYGPTEDALAMRFASSQGGAGAVAMIPIMRDGRLTAMLELSRPGHAFRRTDLQRAERIVHRLLRNRSRS